MSDSYRPPFTVEELLQRYRNGERHFVGTELDDCAYDLQNAVLVGVDFSRSYLTVDFRGAKLSGANFSHANVKTSDFRNADLRGAIFNGAALEETNFEGANLEGATFAGATCYSYMLKEEERPFW